MKNASEIQEIIDAYGQMAECCKIFYDSCRNSGFRKSEAMALTKTYLVDAFGVGKEDDENDDE